MMRWLLLPLKKRSSSRNACTKGPVYQYIDLAEEFQLLGILHEVFEEDSP